eukprot:TRINITY_DN2866_c6_g1_i1.p1 TRINITY_DN2866_c6_g1~~TRINITY_DN2866_c6_g1_i1.p1  ORF type:complete len:687 (+),score=115.49 TRINITY_DN2866_c6_g1_i1:88-2148(+)
MELCKKVCCCGCLEHLARRPGDSADDAARRRIGSAALIWLAIAVTPSAILALGYYGYLRLWVVGIYLCLIASVVGAPMLLFSSVSTHSIAASTMLALTVGFLAIDLGNLAEGGSRMWGLIVLILDACLVFNTRPWVQNTAMVITLIYLAAERSDAVLGYGLTEAALLSEPLTETIPLCDCANPPCQVPADFGFQDLIGFFVVLITDFVLTRGFANGLRQQMALVTSSVEVAELVSAALARFDLDSARGALTASGQGLPPGLASSFNHLLGNLASYRPYLPQSCFEGASQHSPDCSTSCNSSINGVPVAGAPDGAEGLATPNTPGERQESQRDATLCSSVVGQSPLSPCCRSRHSGLRGRPSECGGASTHSSSSPPGTDSRRTSGLGGQQSSPKSGLTANSLTHQPHERRVTLLSRNSSGLLAAGAQADATAMADWLAAEVRHFHQTIQSLGGMTDLLSGDHFSASFGAVKVLGTQRERAVRAAFVLSAPTAHASDGPLSHLQTTVAVCAGSALCGDFGSATAQRFMVIGGVSSFTAAVERAAAAWHVSTLIDSAVRQDTESTWYCRLRKRVIFPKVSRKSIGLWEVVGAAGGPKENEEWMYEMESAQKNPWAAYNEAVQQWCAAGADAALEVIAGAVSQTTSGGAVAEALCALQNHALAGADPPEGPLTAAALAGDPAPISVAAHQ